MCEAVDMGGGGDVCGEDYHDTFVDHHEWRFQQLVTPFGSPDYGVYYCVFCLKQKERKVEYGIAN